MPHQQSTILPMIQQLPQMPNMSMQTPQSKNIKKKEKETEKFITILSERKLL